MHSETVVVGFKETSTCLSNAVYSKKTTLACTRFYERISVVTDVH